MTANNGWPGKPGVPLSPEKDGWHWISGDGGDPEPFYWNGIWQGSDQFSYYSLDESCRYLGPCLTPDEAAALQKRVVELEALIRVKVTEIERAYPHEGHCIECHGAVRAWGDTEHRDDCWYVKARAALEGKKDKPTMTEEQLREMMRDPRYWRQRDPEWVKRVTDGFRALVGGKKDE